MEQRRSELRGETPGEGSSEERGEPEQAGRLGDDLGDEIERSRPQRRAGGQLGATALRAREEEVGDVGRDDDEDEADRGEEDPDAPTRAADERVVEVPKIEPLLRVSVGVGRLEPLRDRARLRLRRGERDPVPPAAHDREVVVPSVLRDLFGVVRARARERDPDVGAVRESGGEREADRGDADDLVRARIESDRASDDAGVRIEVGFPQVRAHHGDRGGLRPIVLRREQPSGEGAEAEHREEVARHLGRVDVEGERSGGGEAEPVVIGGGELFERRRLRAQIAENRRGSWGRAEIGCSPGRRQSGPRRPRTGAVSRAPTRRR